MLRRSFSTTPSLAPLLRAAEIPDAPVAMAVSSFARAGADARAAALAELHSSVGGAQAPLSAAFLRAAAGAPAVLPFFRAVREACCGAGGAAPWSRAVDAAALAALRPLFGPSLTPLRQLELDSPCASMCALVATAAASEVVRPAGAGDGHRVKFGWRRAVFALHHVAEPERLLAVVYAALLAGGPPLSLAALDGSSGGAGPGRTGAPPPAGSRAWAPGAPDDGAPPADTAVFYSVGTGAAGAMGRGLRLGTRLIYGAAGAVAAAAPRVATLCTLSPMPEFMAWLAAEAARGDATPLNAALAGAEGAAGGDAAAALRRAGVAPAGRSGALAGGVLTLLQRGPPPAAWAPVEPLLRRLVLEAGKFHLLRGGPRGGPGCKVAAFHLGNGAALGRVCGGADGTSGGLLRSGGLMANYVYSDAGAEGLRATVEERAGAFAEDAAAAIAAAEARRPVALEWEGCR
jgi:hypothetical protein